MKKISKKRKLNNEGMSLIEILIAMAIVSVVIVPLLYCFVQIHKFNMRGRALQQTTVVAQTVMENCKAYSLEEIETMIDEPDNAQLGSFLKGDYATESVYYAADVDESDPTDPYEFFIDDINIDNQTYGVSFTMVPIVEKTIMQYDNMNDKLDGVFIEGTTADASGKTMQEYEEAAYSEFMQHISDEISSASGGTVVIQPAELYIDFFSDASNPNYGDANIERNIVIKANGSGTDSAKVTYTYKLSAGSYEYSQPGGSPVPYSWSYKEYSKSIDIYSNSDTNAPSHKTQLENIYFFYYPAYSDSSVDKYPCVTDTIKIENDLMESDGITSRDLTVYIIKQKSQDLNSIALEVAETNYYDVKIDKSGGNVVMFNNFDENLGGGTDTQWSGTLGDDIAISVTGLENKGELVIEEQETLMYAVNIVIYKNPSYDADAEVMSGEQVLTLEGTKLNW